MEKQITAKGLEKLKKDLEELKNIERKKIAERLKKSAAFGDLSENSEYAEAKEAQAFLEGKIAELSELIESAVVVCEKNMRGVCQMGSTVLLESRAGKEKFQLVGAGEISPVEGKISVDSPLGKELLNKMEGTVITIATQKGNIQYKILKVE